MWLKLSITCFSLRTNYYFIIESIDTFYFVNNAVVYKALLVKKRVPRLFDIYCKRYLCICQQPDNSRGVSPNGGKSSKVGFQKCEDTTSHFVVVKDFELF